MADDGADEEAVVRHFRALLHFGGAQVKVHLVVGAGHGGQVKAAHAAELQLEGQGGLQVTVNAIFRELRAGQRAKADRQTHRQTPNGTLGPRACLDHALSCRPLVFAALALGGGSLPRVTCEQAQGSEIRGLGRPRGPP